MRRSLTPVVVVDTARLIAQGQNSIEVVKRQILPPVAVDINHWIEFCWGACWGRGGKMNTGLNAVKTAIPSREGGGIGT